MFLLLAALAGCGGGAPLLAKSVDGGAVGTTGTVSGWVVKGPVANGQVTAYRLDPQLKRGDPLAAGTTDESGAFSLDLPSYEGPLLVVASTGTYVEEAIDKQVELGGTELTAVIKDYKPGTGASNVALTPVSHMAYRLAVYRIVTEQRGYTDAIDSAYDALNHHFGDLDWRTTRPSSFGELAGGSQLSPGDRAGLILAAFSQAAKVISDRASLTPGTIVNALSFTQALADDLAADGFFDGKGGTGDITLPPGVPFSPNSSISSTKLDGQTVRLTLASALSSLLNGSRNTTPLTFQDARIFTGDLSRDSDRRIFRDDGVLFASQAPTIVVATPPGRYTRASATSFTVTAVDTGGAGIKGVFAMLQGVKYSASRTNGQWSFSGLPLTPGYNQITVYAEDLAGNSGFGQPEPFQVLVPVTKDNAAPTPFLVTFPSYFSEQNLSVQTDAAGVPVVPAVLQVASADASRVILANDSPIWKAGTRLSWGNDKPTGADLEAGGLQGQNVPFLQFAFNTTPDDAPLSSVSFTITASCSGCPSIPPSTGDAIPAARSVSNNYFVDVPITAETVPALLTAQKTPLDLQIQLSATDAAGNVSSSAPAGLVNLHVHVLGPPLAVKEDTSYATEGDAYSAFPYSIGGGNYGALWTASGVFVSASDVRMVRYVVRNPFPVPIPLALDAFSGASWSVNERWDTEELLYSTTTCNLGSCGPTGSSVTIGGTSYPVFYETQGFSSNWIFSLCGIPQNTSPSPGKVLQLASGSFGCPARSGFPAPARGAVSPIAGGVPVLRAFKNPSPIGGEPVPADELADQTGRHFVVVPPAVGGVPGAIALYITRPFSSRSLPAAPTNFGALSANDGVTVTNAPPPAYRLSIADLWGYEVYPVYSCWDDGMGDSGCDWYKDYLLYTRLASKLVMANENASGSLAFRTGVPLSGGAFIIGADRTFDVRSFNVTVPH